MPAPTVILALCSNLMINSLYLPELREMLAEADREGLREFCTTLHPMRTVEFMEGLDAMETWQVLQHADLQTRVELFGYTDELKQIEIAEKADREEFGELVGSLPADDRVDLLKELPTSTVDALMPLLPLEERRDIQRLIRYPEETAGPFYKRFKSSISFSIPFLSSNKVFLCLFLRRVCCYCPLSPIAIFSS